MVRAHEAADLRHVTRPRRPQQEMLRDEAGRQRRGHDAVYSAYLAARQSKPTGFQRRFATRRRAAGPASTQSYGLRVRPLQVKGRMPGILRIAYKLLVNDKGKFVALLVGITFAVFLMVQMTSMFAGILKSVRDRQEHRREDLGHGSRGEERVQRIPLPDYVLDAVRSIAGRALRGPVLLGRRARASSRAGRTRR